MLEWLIEVDTQLFLFLNGLRAEWLDEPMYWISYKYNWIPFYAVLTGMIFIKYQLKGFWVLLFFALLITLSDQTANLFKSGFERFRPGHHPDLADLVHLVRDRRGGQYGFFSGHASNSFALAIFVSKLLKSKYGWIFPVMIFWASLKAYSRVYLGVHYPGDILAGTLVGIGYGALVYKLFTLFIKRVYQGSNISNNL